MQVVEHDEAVVSRGPSGLLARRKGMAERLLRIRRSVSLLWSWAEAGGPEPTEA